LEIGLCPRRNGAKDTEGNGSLKANSTGTGRLNAHQPAMLAKAVIRTNNRTEDVRMNRALECAAIGSPSY
jgi:hypothetical protein